jgi:hypothetical protein
MYRQDYDLQLTACDLLHERDAALADKRHWHRVGASLNADASN